jgi:hypothetical protein
MTPYSPLNVNRSFGGTCCLYHQGQRPGKARNQIKTRDKQEAEQETTVKGGGKKAPLATCFRSDFLFGLFFDPEDGDNMFLRNIT